MMDATRDRSSREATDGRERSPRDRRFGPVGVALLLGATLFLAGCEGVLSPAGPVAAQQRTILLDSLAIMLCIIVPVMVLAIAFAIWFRAGNTRATRRPDFVFSGKIEIVVWFIPVLVIMFLGAIAWIGSHALDPRRPLDSTADTLEIQAVSLDWKWLFVYPDALVASVNELVVPAGTPLRIRITSASVMNAFFVPRLGSMIYAMNGMETTLYLQADAPGELHGLSSHYSGDGFSKMNFTVDVRTPEAFDAWTEQTSDVDRRLDGAAYRTLMKPTSDVAPFAYGSVEDGLFDRIVSQQIPPSARRSSTEAALTPSGEQAH